MKKASQLKPGPERDDLLKKAQEIDTAAHIDEWLNSSGRTAVVTYGMLEYRAYIVGHDAISLATSHLFARTTPMQSRKPGVQ